MLFARVFQWFAVPTRWQSCKRCVGLSLWASAAAWASTPAYALPAAVDAALARAGVPREAVSVVLA
jgi:hypothetical protein